MKRSWKTQLLGWIMLLSFIAMLLVLLSGLKAVIFVVIAILATIACWAFTTIAVALITGDLPKEK